ncbi:hypothetical protein Rumeso_03848 [Rubellimicrobium mesophilum DSM 19309]|uniref:Uncharacterized protein n=1 Tax=Rubellimicrobium mesophilum DSM 19309 TaxID=442562 RepID=A0A017HJB6_9RHOB|nr:hypothetical protein Rumeso_03848 [Rubellimicrobium mesophilum DSM 19309]
MARCDAALSGVSLATSLREGPGGPICGPERLARAGASPTRSGPEGSSRNETRLGRVQPLTVGPLEQGGRRWRLPSPSGPDAAKGLRCPMRSRARVLPREPSFVPGPSS